MKTNLTENRFTNEHYYVQPDSYRQETKIVVSDFRIQNLSPDELLKRKLDFEREALPHTKLLFNYALKISGNRPEADELYRETYVHAFSYFHKFEEGANCKEWLYRIMRNCYINSYRKDQKKQERLVSK